MVEQLKRSRYSLRRFVYSDASKCPGRFGYHNAHSGVIAESDDLPTEDGIICNNPPETPAKDDPRWPVKCDQCDYRFTDEDQFQVTGDPLFRRLEDGALFPRRELPVGSMWFWSDWYENFYSPGPDGQYLVVRLPGDVDWCVDGVANNCTRPEDKVHKCWVREGAPPNVTAGKNGNTCSAGAGSIAVPGYHGFLRNGYLEEC
jgi:hypothetical protein